ncbi:hypothetical protein [Actinokineospora globicatena]|uniref:hypothetical protein n=1 Tax=Actinokineospora globicatena TaxID=103729 RepID=UPI0020A31707|nr:hypothetical protein [Actinokineospora globicatena]MCP2305902.1 hypothetical protein [Actinokineospora globicatena]GLW80229.1 hypothetical protein Aglo01_47100 [Actinokineospora globicatena]GLW87058.1 hypothetical protein Aglo02_46970 [Actinokineospora globicatena]
MADRLGHNQTAVMFTMLVLGKAVTNTDLKAYGLTLDGADRRALNDRELVETDTQRRPYVHSLTKAGLDWCREEFAAGEPPRPAPRSTFAPALYVILSGLDQYLRRQRLSITDVFGVEVDITPEEIERRVRSAYAKLVDAGDWAGLAELRPMLGGVDRAAVDEVLKDLSRRRVIDLAPESNRKALTAADHEAAVKVGGEDNHLISIGAS